MEMNFDTERALLETKRTELQGALASVTRAIAALDGSQAKVRSASGKTTVAAVHAGRKPMSPAARARVKARMLAFWAAKRKEAVPAAKAKKRR